MQYDITLAIRYVYEHPATAARTLLRMRPLDTPRQRVVSGALTCLPEPDARSEERDFFGNAMTALTFGSPLTEVAFRFEGRVEVDPASAAMDLSPPLGLLADEIAAQAALGPDAPHHFLGDSPRVHVGGAVAEFAQGATTITQTALETVEKLSKALHAHFEFDPTATDVATDPAEAFARGRGVCQDISHAMIAGLRAVGIPAGYVSGFLRTEPPEGQPRLEGADAMHAWVRAWCGREMGWVEIDPTNDMRVGSDHVVVAHGRDYADVAPVKGSLRSAGPHVTEHAVDMIPVE